MGRPAAKPVLSIVLSSETLARIDRVSDKMRRSRSSIIELLCLDALDRQTTDTLRVGIIHEQREGTRA
jgi:predicted transcriptional regulator